MTPAKNHKSHQKPKLIWWISLIMLKCHARYEVKKSSHSEDTSYKIIKQSDWQRELESENSKNKTVTLLEITESLCPFYE